MLCQNCNERTANIHMTKIINNQKKELHLCEVCAREYDQSEFGFEQNFPLQNILPGLIQFDPSGVQEGKSTMQSPLHTRKKCANCGLTYEKFARQGQFGCSECYNQFAQELDPILKRIHGSTGHSGKVPKRSGGSLRIKRRIRELKEELQRCIHREEFERAAQIRDEIKQLEQEIE